MIDLRKELIDELRTDEIQKISTSELNLTDEELSINTNIQKQIEQITNLEKIK